jgi:hypothetical protein
MIRLKKLLKTLLHLNVHFPKRHEEFVLFPKLPIELRLRVWKFVAHRPREVKIYLFTSDFGIKSNVEGQRSIPSILHTCHEAHSEALK